VNGRIIKTKFATDSNTFRSKEDSYRINISDKTSKDNIVSSFYHVDNDSKVNNESGIIKVNNESHFQIQGRNITSGRDKKQTYVKKSCTFSSEEMYKKFNHELQFKGINKKNQNKSKINEEDINILQNSIAEEKKINSPNKKTWENKFKLNKNSDKKSDFIQSTSLDYKFSVNFLKASERPRSSENTPDCNLENTNNKNLFRPEENIKKKYLNSYPTFNKNSLHISSPSKEIKKSSSNITVENSDNNPNNNNNLSGGKISFNSPKSNESGKSLASNNSSKYNYKMFIKSENLQSTNNQECFLDNSRNSNPNILKVHSNKDNFSPKRSGSSLNEIMVTNSKESLRTTKTYNFLSNKFNYNTSPSIDIKNQGSLKSELESFCLVKPEKDNIFGDVLDKNDNETRFLKKSNIFNNYFTEFNYF